MRCCCVPLQVENEDLVFTLETMVEKFGDEIAPYAVSLRHACAPAPARLGVTNTVCCRILHRPDCNCGNHNMWC